MASAMPEYYTSEPHSSPLFNNIDSGGVASFFNDNSNLFGSPGMSWSDPYSSCTSSSYNVPGATFDFACASPQLVYPTEDDVILLGGDEREFLQQALNGCNLEMYPNLVNTLKHLTSPPASPETQYFQHQEVNHFQHQEVNHFHHDHLERRAFLEQELGLAPESPQMSPSNESELSSLDVTYSVDSDEVIVKHEPPPLNNKRLEKVEYIDDNIEAAEVSVDLIQNRRPFRCWQQGCNKTFKNPQTMKMHHKTHYTDGSAMINADGLPTLPILTASSKLGNNKKIPSRCPKCRKTFVGLYELRRHYGRKHSEGEKPFGCRKCGKRFYIEVDLRDHEKLCGEPIECKCGLKFAFKCNLVAHKKAHPVCQEQSSHKYSAANSNNSSCNHSTTTSDEDSISHSGGRSTSSPLQRLGTKRHRATYEEAAISSSITSHHMSTYTTPTPDFENLPDKAARYDFDMLHFSDLWDAIPSQDLEDLPREGLASPVYASRILDNYCFSQSFSQSHPHRTPSQSALELMKLINVPRPVRLL